jgi:hypothetical protein
MFVYCFRIHSYFRDLFSTQFDEYHGKIGLGPIEVMYMKAIISPTLAAILTVFPIAALAEEIFVGSCPTKIIVERLGEWADTSNDVETVDFLMSNPNRTNEVAAVYAIDDASMLEVKVLSLRSLEKFQGGISENDFNAISVKFADAFQGPSPDMQRRIDKVIEGNVSGTGSTVSHLRYEPAILSQGKLIGFALAEASIPGLGVGLYETAMKMQHMHGCIVQANFSIAVSSGSKDRLNQAISDFVMR